MVYSIGQINTALIFNKFKRSYFFVDCELESISGDFTPYYQIMGLDLEFD